MASGTQQHQHHQQQQQQHEHLLPQQQGNQMQFTANQVSGITSSCFDSQLQMHQHNTMSPIGAQMSVDHNQGHMISMNPHQQQPQLMGSVVGPNVISQDPCNPSTSHLQQQPAQQQHQQKSQILPLLLSPRPPNLKANSIDQSDQQENDHDQIIEQVISLENEFSDSSGIMANVDSNLGLMLGHQHQSQHPVDINLIGASCMPDNNQLSSSSEDLLNLLLELDPREPSNLAGLGCGHQLDQDEKVGIENIRKQLMSCEVQSEQHQNTNSMSPIINQMTGQARTNPQQQNQQTRNQRQQVTQQQLISQSAPVITHHQQQPHQLTGPSLSQQQQQQQQQQQPHQRLSVDQNMLHGSYSNVPVSTVPVSSSGQSYAPQQHQNVSRISQSNPMSIVNNSPSPSWQQPQLSPYSPQNPHNNSRTTSQRQGQQHQHTIQQHQNTTSPQMQQLHHPLQQRSPSQSVSPPATTEPSPVVKKNPLLNAQLVNSRTPSITPTRFMSNQTNLLNQNPILNAKLSQSSFVTNSGGTVGSPVNPSLNPPNRFIQQTQQTSNFNYDITQQQPQNAQQHTPPQTGHMSLYRPSDQQQTNQVFRTTTAATGTVNTGGPQLTMNSTSPTSGSLSQQVKQEIRRKVQQPRQQHQTTSLLKQLLSDDNK